MIRSNGPTCHASNDAIPFEAALGGESLSKYQHACGSFHASTHGEPGVHNGDADISLDRTRLRNVLYVAKNEGFATYREVVVKKWLRRIRAAIGIGLTWAAAWFAAGMILLLIVGPDAADVPFPLFFGLLGFLTGATFSLVLGIVARRRRFDQMSLPRFAGWGAIGGLSLSGILIWTAGPDAEFLVLGPVFSLAGAISAAGTLAVARRAEGRALVDANAKMVEAGRDNESTHK